MSSADSTRRASRSTGAAPISVTLDGLADPVIAISTDGLLRYANDTAAVVLGWDRRELLGSSVLDLVHPDDLNMASASLRTVRDKRVGDLVSLRIRTGYGTWRYLELRGSFRDMSTDDVTDESGHIVIVARDVTERHRLEFDQGDIQVLRAVMANMHGMVVLADAGGLIRSINGAVTRFLGHDPETVRGQSILSYLHPDDRDQVLGDRAVARPAGVRHPGRPCPARRRRPSGV